MIFSINYNMPRQTYMVIINEYRIVDMMVVISCKYVLYLQDRAVISFKL